MLVTLKGLIGSAVVIGLSSAIVIPLSMKSKNGTSKLSSASGGGSTDLSISKCSDFLAINYSEIQFGSKVEGEVCGAMPSEGSTAIGNVESFNQLFKEKGNKSEESGSSSHKEGSMGKTVCGSKPFWIITGAKDGEEYLGSCEGDKGSKNLFVKKEVKEVEPAKKKIVSLSICQGSCGENKTKNMEAQVPEELEEPITREWIGVIFKKQNQSISRVDT